MVERTIDMNMMTLSNLRHSILWSDKSLPYLLVSIVNPINSLCSRACQSKDESRLHPSRFRPIATETPVRPFGSGVRSDGNNNHQLRPFDTSFEVPTSRQKGTFRMEYQLASGHNFINGRPSVLAGYFPVLL